MSEEGGPMDAAFAHAIDKAAARGTAGTGDLPITRAVREFLPDPMVAPMWLTWWCDGEGPYEAPASGEAA